jgi:hypothetical protein
MVSLRSVSRAALAKAVVVAPGWLDSQAISGYARTTHMG